MSAIVRDPQGRIKLFTKGADTVILERLAENNPYVDQTCAHLEEYATEGLRTLCIAYRDVSEIEYKQWAVIFDKAATTINNRQEELDKAAEIIERDLYLLGATAIEDKLQDGVPDTIHTLAQAGIKIWVLTGDRQETAINIGYSCKLITEEMTMMICNEDSASATAEWIESRLSAVRGNSSIEDLIDADEDAESMPKFFPFQESDQALNNAQRHGFIEQIKTKFGFGSTQKLLKNAFDDSEVIFAQFVFNKSLWH